jgi:putative ABC transport system permease protein
MNQRRILRLAGLTTRLMARTARHGFSGFRLFLACLALGVAAIASVGGVAEGLLRGLEREGRNLVGADLEARLTHRQMSAAEAGFFYALGHVSLVAEMRSMASSQSAQTFVELKAVDDAYPLYGTLQTSGAVLSPSLLAQDARGRYGALADPAVAARLRVKIGDSLRVGEADFVLRGLIKHEPDRVEAGFSFGPRLMLSMAALGQTGLVRQGALITWLYRLQVPDTQSDGASLDVLRESLEEKFPQAGWRLRDHRNAAPSVERFIKRIALFLALVGLSSLVLGGIGVGNAVRNHLERERETIAIMKCLGGTGPDVITVYLGQVMLLAAVGIALGLVLGAGMPFALAQLLGTRLPVPFFPAIDIASLLLAAAYGFLVSFAFTLWPIARAAKLKPAGLFRALVAPPVAAVQGRISGPIVVACIATLALACAIALALSAERELTAYFLAGLAGSLLLFWLSARGLTALLVALPRPSFALLRLIFSNLTRPGAPTVSVVLSLGLGLTLFAAIALVNANFALQVRKELPADAPAFFLLDLQPSQRRLLHDVLNKSGAVKRTEEMPMLRGFITKVNGIPVEKLAFKGEDAWVLRGDRGLTFALHQPDKTKLTAGRWWSREEARQKLVSFDVEAAQELGLKLGDTLSVNVLGREITARIFNLREIDWSSMNINFVMIFSPPALADAPHSLLTTVTLTEQDAGQADAQTLREETLRSAIIRALPAVTVVRVREALADVGRLIGQIGTGVELASLVTLVAGLLVLVGAMAANFQARLYDAVVLKVLGATRGYLLVVYAIEYGLLGLATALIAAVLGSLMAWGIMTGFMDMPFTLLPLSPLLVLAAGLVTTVLFGLAGTLRALTAKPAASLRAL